MVELSKEMCFLLTSKTCPSSTLHISHWNTQETAAPKIVQPWEKESEMHYITLGRIRKDTIILDNKWNIGPSDFHFGSIAHRNIYLFQQQQQQQCANGSNSNKYGQKNAIV